MSADHLLPEKIGLYRVVRLLGKGGMGVVYEAVQETIARRVAIKVLNSEYARNPTMVGRLFNEARAVNLIEHPSLVQISEFGQHPDGTSYLVMEFLKGESLGSRLRNGNLPILLVLQIGWQVADALAAAHDKGIVHRDLKPDNLMLVADAVAPGGERVKLLDFGIAKLTQQNVEQTGSNVLLGTPLYMSPEQCRGAGNVDARSDVYSLGVILYRMLAGRPPFQGEMGELIAQHLQTPPPPLGDIAPHIPLDLAALVHRLLIKDKEQRSTMHQVRTDLGRMLAELGRNTAPRTSTEASPPGKECEPGAAANSTLGHSVGQTRPGDRRIRMLGGLAVGGVAVVGAWLLLRTHPPRHDMTSLRTYTALAVPAKTPPPPLQAVSPPPLATVRAHDPSDGSLLSHGVSQEVRQPPVHTESQLVPSPRLRAEKAPKSASGAGRFRGQSPGAPSSASAARPIARSKSTAHAGQPIKPSSALSSTKKGVLDGVD